LPFPAFAINDDEADTFSSAPPLHNFWIRHCSTSAFRPCFSVIVVLIFRVFFTYRLFSLRLATTESNCGCYYAVIL